MRALVASLAISVLVLAGCGDDDTPVATGTDPTTTTSSAVAADPAQARLDEARQRWEQAGVEDYRLEWTLRCFCPTTAFVDTIVDGSVVEHRPAPDSEALHDPGAKTVEDIFDEVQAAIESDPVTLEVSYDEDTGAVLSYWVDEDEMIADEEHGIDAELEPLDGGAEPTEVVLADVTEAHGCGYGFQAGRPDQRVGIFLAHESGPAPSGTVTLPADDWDTTVQIGADLFANWCDDVISADDPTPRVDTTWQLVEGTLEVTTPEPGAPSPAVVAATGLVAEHPDGERVPLGDITVENPFYGAFAG